MAKRKNGNPETMPEPPCYLIDLLPRRAPEERAAQYSALERYFRREKETKELARRLVRLLLKLHCYEELFLRVGIGWKRCPPPGQLAKGLRVCLAGEGAAMEFDIGRGKARLLLESGDLYLCLYTGDRDCAELVSHLAWSEGLFFRRLDG